MDVPEYNVFDGMGVMDVGFSEKIGEDLELGYAPSICIIRNTFIKGAVATMDFKKFARATGKTKVQDIWGILTILTN